VSYLGFLKFLKRNKKKEPDLGPNDLKDLDVLPPPPDFNQDLGKVADLPELPDIPDVDEGLEMKDESLDRLRPLDESEMKLPDVPKPSFQQPKFPRRPLFGIPNQAPAFRVEKPPPEPDRNLGNIHHYIPKGPHYINVDMFRGILSEVSGIKSDLKILDQSILKINNKEEKVLEKWQIVMSDLQKKLLYMDKTLFKR